MLTLTLDKLASIRLEFSMNDPVHQGPRWSTPKQIIYPGAFAVPEKAAYARTGVYSATGWDSTYQKALYPHL
jgi:hypothetical protein